MKMDTLHELYVDELKDLHDAEKQLIAALPKMAKAATHPELKRAFETHLEQTREQLARLETILGDLEELGRMKKCKGMQGLIEEGKELIQEKPDPDVLDAGLISKAQHVEHYEIAGYGTVRTYAQLMGHTNHVELLQRTLDEEGETDKLLTALAERSINIDANEGVEGEMPEHADEGRSSRGRTRTNGRSRATSRGGRQTRTRSRSRSRQRA